MERMKNTKQTKTGEPIVVPGWLDYDESVALWNKVNEGIPFIKYLFSRDTGYIKQTLIKIKK